MTLIRRRVAAPTEEELALARKKLWVRGGLIVGGVILFAIAASFFLSWVSSFSRPPQNVLDAEAHIRRAGTVYSKFMQSNKGRAPASAKELADFLKSMSQAELEGLGITDRETALVSPRDGQPFGVVHKVDMSMMRGSGKAPTKNTSSGPPIIMYEKTGSGGKRYVLFLAGGGYTLMDDEAFRRAVPDAN